MNGPAAVTPAVGRSPQHNPPNSDAGRPREPDATAAPPSSTRASSGDRCRRRPGTRLRSARDSAAARATSRPNDSPGWRACCADA